MSTTDNGTVMGPGYESIPHVSLLNPPTLKPETDRMQWREDIRDWSANITACADGGDTRAKGVATCLALTVYRSLDLSLKEQVKESVRSGELVLKPSTDSDSKEQVKMLEKIITIIAKDTPVDRVTRMVRLNTQVHKCTRRDNESIKQYVNRFKRPALAYMNLTRNGQDSSESQVFAMTLILNAKLPSQTFSNLISSVINNVSSKQRTDNSNTAIRTNRLTKIAEILKEDKPADKQSAQECAATIEAAIEAQRTHEEKDEQGYISFQDAVRTLEAAGLEQRDLTNASENQIGKSSAFMSWQKPNHQPYRYERPPYTRRFNTYRRNRYRQSENETDEPQEGLRNNEQGDLRTYIERNRSEVDSDNRKTKKARNTDGENTQRPTYFR